MARTITNSLGNELTLKEGDKVQLKDGRILKVDDLNPGFGKVKLVDDQGGVVFTSPSDIVQVLTEVIEAVQKAQTFWSWFKNTTLVKSILSIFKKKQ